jgi:predicted metal-dependent hydrolase
MKSKFGSYHRKNHEITINTILAKLDQSYLFYVLNHEYAHTKVFNHQKAFYHLLEEMHPNCKQIQKDLKKIAII